MKQSSSTKPLTPTLAANLPAGRYATGTTGLSLIKRQTDKGSYRFRYTDPKSGTRLDKIIGHYPEMDLEAAREHCLGLRRLLESGQDLPDPRKEARVARAKHQQEKEKSRRTFLVVASEWLEDSEEKGVWTNNATGARVAFGYLKTYLYPVIGSLPIDKVTPQALYECLLPIWRTKHSTATKIRGMLYRIFRWARAVKLSTLESNPASMDGDLGVLLDQVSHGLPPPQNHAFCPVGEVPRLFRELNAVNTTPARLCMFLILTAGRAQAAREARWGEIDFDRKTWTIPLGHDKIKSPYRDRTIYLSDEAIELLRSLPRRPDSDLLFPNPDGRPYSNAVTTMVMHDLHEKRQKADGRGWIDPVKSSCAQAPSVITIHGTARATFRTWAKDDIAGNNRRFDQEAVELCLLHVKYDPWRGAYDRSLLINERRFIMAEWGRFCFQGLREDAERHNGSVLAMAVAKEEVAPVERPKPDSAPDMKASETPAPCGSASERQKEWEALKKKAVAKGIIPAPSGKSGVQAGGIMRRSTLERALGHAEHLARLERRRRQKEAAEARKAESR